eukprot:NODE_347_length_10448_cov_0.163687.p2 type:complete len:285 gc:universal NODE_347_length_10448_cov_0.163687:3240-4094(+)
MFPTTSHDSLVSAEYQQTGKPFVIGVAGGSASGKSGFCELIRQKMIEDFNVVEDNVLILNATNFYKSLSDANITLAKEGKYNFDHPFAIDLDLLCKTLRSLVSGRSTVFCRYNFATFQQEIIGILENTPSIIIIEGILVIYFEKLRDILNMKIFLDVDSDTRLSNTVLRDTIDDNDRLIKPLDQVLDEWLNYVKPSFEDYVLPSKKYADVVVPRGIENVVAINLIVQHVYELVKNGEVGRSKTSASLGSLVNLEKIPEESLPLSPRMETFTFDSGESIYKPVPE